MGGLTPPDGYRFVKGLLWPVDDVGCIATIHGTAGLDQAYQHCRGFDVAVQAGGNCGVWPAAMGKKFEAVYTFEPDPVNFRCLCANATAPNVFKFNAALGNHRGTVGLEMRPGNCGAHKVSGPGSIPVLRIDDLGLTDCDLIYLDIEGSELHALRGAADTIEACWPVIVVEDKGVSKEYAVGYIEKEMAERFGYRVAERVHRDTILVPRE